MRRHLAKRFSLAVLFLHCSVPGTNHERDRDGDGDLMLLCVGEKEKQECGIDKLKLNERDADGM